MTEAYDFSDTDNQQQAVRRTQLSVTPVPQEEARRIHAGSVRGFARAARACVADACHPLILIGRGTRRGAVWSFIWWRRTDKDKRRGVLVAVALVLIVVAVLPRGPWILAGVLMASAALAGRAPRIKEDPRQVAKLQAIYNGLVPYLMDPNDPDQLFVPNAEFKKAFDSWVFDERGRLIKLDLHYSPYFTDSEAESKAKVEQAIERKNGRANDYLYEWDEERNTLSVAIMPGLAPEMVPAPAPASGAAPVPGREAVPPSWDPGPHAPAPSAFDGMVEAPTGRPPGSAPG